MVFVGCLGTNQHTPDLYTYAIVNAYPHDGTCYTQGLLVRCELEAFVLL